MTFLLFLHACFCRPPPTTQLPEVSPSTNPQFDDEDLLSGYIGEDGRFNDAIFKLRGEVSSEWVPEFGSEFGLLRLRLSHKSTDTKIEIWRFPYTLIEPTPLDFCEWSFVDLGLYGHSSAADPRLVATCFPEGSQDSFVFAFLRHRNQGTWQFEIHASQISMILSKNMGEELLNRFYWIDDEDPVLGRKN